MRLAKLLRVEEVLRRCWCKRKFGAAGAGARPSKSPEGVAEEFALLDLTWLSLAALLLRVYTL